MIANLTVITDNLDYLLGGRMTKGEPGGVLLTLLMAVGSAVLALVGGILLAGLAWRFDGIVRRLLFTWAEFIRGIPLIFVIFWLYFLLPIITGSNLSGALTVTLALEWFTSAAVMHTTLAGLQALPSGQREAAVAGGLNAWQILCLVLLPQAMRNVFPSYVGLFIVNVPELTTVAGQVNSRVQVYPVAIFIFTGLVYYLLCSGLNYTVSRRRGTVATPSPLKV